MADLAEVPCRSKPGLRDPDTELEQLSIDLGGAPKRVLKAHSSDQIPHLFGDPWPASAERDFHCQ
jgi:hypothetical protein